MGKLTATLLAALLVVPAVAGAFKRTAVGDPLPTFALQTATGAPVDLAQHKGTKATVVAFWASWSPRSAELLEDLQTLWNEHREVGLSVVAVNVEREELDRAAADAVTAALQAAGASFPAAVDRGLGVFQAYGVVAVPSAVVADGEGKIVALCEGYSTVGRAQFREDVAAALGLGEPKAPKTSAVARARAPKGKAERFVQLGKGFLRKKMDERALENFAKAVEEDPEYPEALTLLAEALAAAGRQEEADAARARLAALGIPPAPPPAATAGSAGRQ